MAIGAQQPGEDSEAAAVGRGPIPRLPAGTAAADIEIATHARRARIHAIALLVLSLGYSAALFQRLAFQGLAPHLRHDLGLDFRSLADLGAVFFWIYLGLMLPSGVLVDVFGARRVASVAAVISGVGCALFSMAASGSELLVARILISAGGAFAFVCMMRFVLVTFPERRATAAGRAIFIGNLGAIAAGAPLAVILSLLSWRQLWAALAVGWLLLALAIHVMTPLDRTPASAGTVIRGSVSAICETLRCLRVWLGGGVLAGLAGTHWAGANLIAPIALSAAGFDPVDVGTAISFLVTGYAVGAVAWGWLGDRIPKEGLVFCACAVAASAWLAIGTSDALALQVVLGLLFIAGFSAGAFGLVYGAIAAHHPAARSGVVVSAVNCGIPFGAASAQSIAGRLDPALVFVPVMLGVIVSLFGALILWAAARTPEGALHRCLPD